MADLVSQGETKETNVLVGTKLEHSGGAGVILVTNHPDLGQCLILFQEGRELCTSCGKDWCKKHKDRKICQDGEPSTNLYNHPGGRQETEHLNQIDTAMHELTEETCGTVYAEYDVLKDQYLKGLYCGGRKRHLFIGLEVHPNRLRTNFKENRKVLKEKKWKKCWLEMTRVRYVTLELFQSNAGEKEIQDSNGETILLRNPIQNKHIDLAQRTFEKNSLHSHEMVDNCKIFGKKSEKMPDGVRTLQISIAKN